MIKTYSSLILLFLVLPMISPGNTPGGIVRDTSSVSIRRPPVDKISQYAHSKTFQYGTAGEPQSVWQKIQAWVWNQFSKLLQLQATQNILGGAFYLLLIFLIVVIIKKYSEGGLFRTKNSSPDSFTMKETADMPADWEPQIQKAIENKNYNLAIRLLYKKSLIQLQHQGWISWQKDKTNHAYIYEITQTELQQIFRQLTRYYEYAQYGNFSVDKMNFQQAHKQFKRLESMIDSSST